MRSRFCCVACSRMNPTSAGSSWLGSASTKRTSEAFLLNVHNVLDPYEELVQAGKLRRVPPQLAQDWDLKNFLDQVFAAHDYNFVPSQGDDDDDAPAPVIVDKTPPKDSQGAAGNLN